MLKVIVALAAIAMIVMFVRRQKKRADARKSHEARQLRHEVEQEEWDAMISQQRDNDGASAASRPPSR
jgi:hypothetical protein